MFCVFSWIKWLIKEKRLILIAVAYLFIYLSMVRNQGSGYTFSFTASTCCSILSGRTFIFCALFCLLLKLFSVSVLLYYFLLFLYWLYILLCWLSHRVLFDIVTCFGYCFNYIPRRRVFGRVNEQRYKYKLSLIYFHNMMCLYDIFNNHKTSRHGLKLEFLILMVILLGVQRLQ